MRFVIRLFTISGAVLFGADLYYYKFLPWFITAPLMLFFCLLDYIFFLAFRVTDASKSEEAKRVFDEGHMKAWDDPRFSKTLVYEDPNER